MSIRPPLQHHRIPRHIPAPNATAIVSTATTAFKLDTPILPARVPAVRLTAAVASTDQPPVQSLDRVAGPAPPVSTTCLSKPPPTTTGMLSQVVNNCATLTLNHWWLIHRSICPPTHTHPRAAAIGRPQASVANISSCRNIIPVPVARLTNLFTRLHLYRPFHQGLSLLGPVCRAIQRIKPDKFRPIKRTSLLLLLLVPLRRRVSCE